ncbi:prepilin-type N-terminal cleavage/methylation domain-containing protein (plasmid) [Cupriavidus pinatubonensis]|uniref:type 4 pilus major pilin n=1 Tax=Cupriavidus pinatubonensis TaxID=248026 RepID=UPI001C72BDD0|nr:type 4 pilus major pilin [Cupriavidus pinatubonensis]QYY33636.1 prepilin-type N-terminal cleavage/methylation domain-containing protein [Cupriavidus pinatubonensis]
MQKNVHRRLTSRGRPAEGGFTLIELMVVIGIAVLIYTLAGGLSNTAVVKSSALEESTNIQNLFASLRDIRTSQGYPASANLVQALQDQRNVPANITITGGNLMNSYGGTYTLATIDSGGTVTVAVTNIPNAECRKLVTSVKKSIARSVGVGATATIDMATVSTATATNPLRNGRPYDTDLVVLRRLSSSSGQVTLLRGAALALALKDGPMRLGDLTFLDLYLHPNVALLKNLGGSARRVDVAPLAIKEQLEDVRLRCQTTYSETRIPEFAIVEDDGCTGSPPRRTTPGRSCLFCVSSRRSLRPFQGPWAAAARRSESVG